jgi:transcription antitermination factor NusG
MNGQKKMEKIYETSTTTHYDQNGNKQLEETGIEKRYYINNMLSRVVTKNKTIIYEEGRKHRVEFKKPNENIQIDSTFFASGLISKVEEWQENKKIKISLFNEMGKLIQLTIHYSLVEDETAYYQKLAYNKSEIFIMKMVRRS